MAKAASSSSKPKSGLGASLRGIIPRNRERKPEQKESLEQRLEYRDGLVERLASKEKEAGDLRDQLARLRISQRNARDEVSGWKATVAQETRGGGQAHSKPRLDAAEAELRSVTARIEDRESRFQAVREEIEDPRQQIQLISQGASVEEVKAHLSALVDQEAQIAHLEGLIGDMEARSVPDDFGDGELDALQQSREDLLADIAAGIAQRDELEALDAQIAEILDDTEGQQAEALSEVRDHRQTVAGLERRLSAAKARHAELSAHTPKVIEQLLIARAAGVYQQYRRQAEALMESYHQLQGLQELLVSAVPQSKVRLLSPRWPNLFIPSVGASVEHGQEAEHLCSGREERQKGILLEDAERALSGLAVVGVSELFGRGGKA